MNVSVKTLMKTFSSSRNLIEHILFSSLNSLFHSNEKYAQSEGAVVEESPLGFSFPIGGASEDVLVDESPLLPFSPH